jgi:uncharacterized protein (DUF1501 family)
MQRRELLKALACTGLTTASSLRNLSFAAQPSGTLVVVFLRGGADSLHMAAPVTDRHYVANRPVNLRITDSGENSGLRLPKGFVAEQDCRIHSAAAPLLDLFQSVHAQLLHACGLANATRSHFVAQEILESGTQPQDRTLASTPGWITPFIRPSQVSKSVDFVATSAGQIRSLQGLSSGMSLVGELRHGLNLPGDAVGKSVLEALYANSSANSGPDPVRQVGQQTLQQLAWVDSQAPRIEGRIAPYTPPKGVSYNTENYEWLHAVQTVAQLIRMDVGLQVACLDLGGWDTHEYQGGKLNNLVRQWSANLRALFDDMQAAGKRTTIVVVSEFGRRLRANASGGTDHGHAGIVWALDTQARGLLPPTLWPGLATDQLDQGMDLQHTRDVKQVLADLAKRVLS